MKKIEKDSGSPFVAVYSVLYLNIVSNRTFVEPSYMAPQECYRG